MLKVIVPTAIFNAELLYTLDVVFREFFSVQYEVVTDATNKNIILCDDNNEGKEIEIDASFFYNTLNHWGEKSSLPTCPLQAITPEQFGVTCDLIEPSLPVLYGTPDLDITDNKTI